MQFTFLFPVFCSLSISTAFLKKLSFCRACALIPESIPSAGVMFIKRFPCPLSMMAILLSPEGWSKNRPEYAEQLFVMESRIVPRAPLGKGIISAVALVIGEFGQVGAPVSWS